MSRIAANSEVLELLREIVARQEAMNARQDSFERLIQEALTPDGKPSHQTCVNLVREIWAFTEGQSFIVADLTVHANIMKTNDSASGLRGAIIAAVKAVNGKKVGKLLSDLEGQNFDGLIIQGGKPTRDGIRWKILQKKM